MGRLNRGQRIVLVVALGAALYVLGVYITTLDTPGSGWVAYAPLSQVAHSSFTGTPFAGLHPWVRLVVWLGLTVIWAGCSVALLRSRPRAE